jgi:HlyD family secretion protein
MNQEQVKHTINSHYRKLKKWSKKMEENFEVEAIHEFRVEYKKLRAFLRMLSMQLSITIKISKKLEKAYRIAGSIRDLQLQQQRITEATHEEPKKPLAYLSLLDIETNKLKPELSELLLGNTVSESRKRTDLSVLSDVPANSFQEFAKQKWKAVHSIIASGDFCDDNIHAIRKHLKDISYNFKKYTELVKDGGPVNIWGGKDESYCNKLIEDLGIFQDKCTAIALLKSFWINSLSKYNRDLLERIKWEWIRSKVNFKKLLVMRLRFSLLFLVILFVSCSNRVEQIKPSVENITESVYAAGVIKAKNQYQVFSTVSGIINKIVVTENDLVKAGSPLILVEDETTKINRENASLSADYAAINANREKLTELKNNIILAKNKYENDSLSFKRQQNLWNNNNIGTKFELEQKELAYLNAKTNLESAKIRYADQLKQLQLNAELSKNNLAISKFREKDFIIKSEKEGKVYSLLKKQGEMVSPQSALAVIGDATVFLLELQIDEYDIVKVKPGQKVLVSMDSYKGEVFEAVISKINPLMNERTKSFLVEAEFTKQPPALYPNLTVEANIVIQVKEKALTIPRNYLIDDSLVLIDKNKKKSVVTGLKDYQKAEIINGLSANDIIYKPH